MKLTNIELGDTLVFSDGTKLLVESISPEGDGFWINNEIVITEDGLTDITNPKAPYVISVRHEETLGDLLSMENLPRELAWARRKSPTRYDDLYEFREKYSYRDFHLNELAVVYYRLTNKVVSKATLIAALSKSNRVKRTGRGRYKCVK